MRAFSLAVVLLTAVGITAVLFGVRSELAEANHSAPGTVDTHIVHLHDDYFHSEPLSPTFADHTAAQTACEVADPPATCNMNIEAGDSVEWWTKNPFAQAPHSVTECTDNTFTTCGAAVDAANPIGDSGFFSGGAVTDTNQYGPITFPTVGTFYYYCSVHPAVMRGAVVVAAAQQTPTPSPSPTAGSPTASAAGTGAATPTPSGLPAAAPSTGGTPSEGSAGWVWLIAAIGGAIVVASAATGVGLLRRR